MAEQPADPASGDNAPEAAADPFTVLGYLIAGIAVWGGLGWLVDRGLGTRIFVVIGVLLGLVASIYLTYVRYNRR